MHHTVRAATLFSLTSRATNVSALLKDFCSNFLFTMKIFENYIEMIESLRVEEKKNMEFDNRGFNLSHPKLSSEISERWTIDGIVLL